MANKNFMDLISDSLTDSKLVNAFIAELETAASGLDLQKWFDTKGYSLDINECNKIYSMKPQINNFNNGPHLLY